jgi:hypothetical protein
MIYQHRNKFYFGLCKKNATKDTKNNIMKSYVDGTGQVARITTFMKDIGTGNMAKIEDKLTSKIDSIFPKDRYKVVMTGKALIFEKEYPIR